MKHVFTFSCVELSSKQTVVIYSLKARMMFQTHCEEVGEGRCGSENLQQVSCTSEAVSNITELTLTIHL